MVRTQSGFRFGLVIGVALLGSNVAVRAADVPIPGKLLLIRDTKVAKVVSKANGTPFTLADPTANPSSLLMDDLSDSGALTEADLATGNWRALGNPPGSKGYIYTNSAAAAGTDPVKKVVLKPQLIKIIAKDDGTLDGPAGVVQVSLTIGADTYCARFGGTNVKNTNGLVKRKDALPPADCSVPAPPVCGNGMVEAPDEECDDGDTDPGDGCDATCQLESTNPALCAGVPSTSGTTLAMTLVADGLESPVHVAAPRLDTNRIFIVEQPGRIRVVRNGVLLGTPYLAIEGLVAYSSSGTEEGLLSVAFDPAFESNGRFYVYYVNNSSNLVIARYTADGDPSTSDVADDSSEVIITTVPHPGAGNHNGGNLQIGPDGFLYAGIGDGGGGCDPGDNAQDDGDALGKLLRLDLGASFPINPVSAIWHKGLRNPFRFSFDRGTGDLYIGDVGQNAYEEVDYDASPVSSGVNWGWDFYEANHCSNEDPMVGGSGCSANSCPGTAGLTFPVLEYNHGAGCSITGGYVYRGCALPDLLGTYFYSDICTSFIRTFQGVVGGVAQNQANRTADVDPDGDLAGVSSFGEDARGELYVVSHANFAAGAGAVYRIEPE